MDNTYICDAETYWDKDYTLSKMTNEAYLRDPRFALHGMGVRPLGEKPMWLDPQEFKSWAESVDWSSAIVVCHNTRFDGAIMSWKYGIRPKRWMDTMGMYRALHPELRSYSLAVLSEYFNFQKKGDASWTRGKRSFTYAEYAVLGDYCLLDCALTEHLYLQAREKFTPFERAVMDMTLRMFIEPILEIDRPVLQEFLDKHITEKKELLARSGLDLDQVMSSTKFADALRALGVEPPMKSSPTDSKRMIYAFAKTDAAMTELADHEDPRVQTLAAARLGNKSTLLETRTRHLIEIGERGKLPIPLNYWGAKVTGRHSGADKINPQNFTRGSTLRDGIVAPKGYKVVVGDSSNIELRLVMALSGQWDQVEQIRYYDSIPEAQRDTDLYCDFATNVYGRKVTRKDKDERFVGKQGMLSLQYMASGQKFHNMLRQKGRHIPEGEAERIKNVYRSRHRKVVAFWYYCEEEVIPAIASRQVMRPVDVNGWFLTNATGFALPGEIGVQYPDLHQAGGVWSYSTGRGVVDLYGAKVVENVCQHAARQVVMYQALLVGTRYRVVHSVHDELVCCVPEYQAEECARFMSQCLATAPKWTQGRLPVTGEVNVGDSYGAAK